MQFNRLRRRRRDDALSRITRSRLRPHAFPRCVDEEDTWQAGGVYLGHRCVVILDSDRCSATPMHAPEDLPILMGRDESQSVLHNFDLVDWIRSMCGPLSDDPALALGLIESSTYLRNQLLRDSDWVSMDHSVELRAPLVDAHLLSQLQPWLDAFARYPRKTLLAGAPIKPLPHEVVGRRKTGFEIPMANRIGATRAGTVGAGSRGWRREVARSYAGSPA